MAVTKNCKGVFLIEFRGQFFLEIVVTKLQDPSNACKFRVIVVKGPAALKQFCKGLLCLLFLKRVIEDISKELEHILSSVEIPILQTWPNVVLSSSTSKTTYPAYASVLCIKQV